MSTLASIPAPSRHAAAFDVSGKCIHFLLGGQSFAAPIASVVECGDLPSITPLPATHASLRGVIHFRGEILPLFDLHQLLGGANSLPSPAEKLLVIHTPGSPGPCAFAVDRVAGLISSDSLHGAIQLLDWELLFQQLPNSESALKGAHHVR